jgi:hypothetical protein
VNFEGVAVVFVVSLRDMHSWRDSQMGCGMFWSELVKLRLASRLRIRKAGWLVVAVMTPFTSKDLCRREAAASGGLDLRDIASYFNAKQLFNYNETAQSP